MLSIPECCGFQPSTWRIFSELATSTAGSPARLGDSTTAISRPVIFRATSIISRTLNPLPLPRLQIKRECSSRPSSASK